MATCLNHPFAQLRDANPYCCADIHWRTRPKRHTNSLYSYTRGNMYWLSTRKDRCFNKQWVIDQKTSLLIPLHYWYEIVYSKMKERIHRFSGVSAWRELKRKLYHVARHHLSNRTPCRLGITGFPESIVQCLSPVFYTSCGFADGSSSSKAWTASTFPSDDLLFVIATILFRRWLLGSTFEFDYQEYLLFTQLWRIAIRMVKHPSRIPCFFPYVS